MEFDIFCEKINYVLTFDNGIVLKGDYEKVGQHFGDFDCPRKLTFNSEQPEEIKPIMDKYIAQFGTDPSFFTAMWYKENA
jgi:hypothetical protein